MVDDDDDRDVVTRTVRENAADADLETMQLRGQVRVTWTDARGPQERKISRRATMGSADTVDVVIADPTVSRLHAELDPRDDGLWFHDLGSRNGTYFDTL